MSSIVRQNLLTIKGYTPYCGLDAKCPGTWPRTVFKNGQFECPSCGYRTQLEDDFIKKYEEVQKTLPPDPFAYARSL